MKNNNQVLAFLTIIAFVSTSISLHAQRNAIKLALSGISSPLFEYEHAINDNTSILMGFQKWNMKKTSNTAVPFFGVIASDKTETKINGYRFEVLARRFNKKAFNGAFIEGGLYAGMHDISIEKTSSTTNLISILFWTFDEITTTTTKHEQYKSVLVGGGKLGTGFQKTFGGFNLELSAGLNFNVINSQNIRPTLPFKPVSPYARLAMGAAF